MPLFCYNNPLIHFILKQVQIQRT